MVGTITGFPKLGTGGLQEAFKGVCSTYKKCFSQLTQTLLFGAKSMYLYTTKGNVCKENKIGNYNIILIKK